MRVRGEIVFSFVLLVLFGVVSFLSFEWPEIARRFPLASGMGGIVISGILLALAIRRGTREKAEGQSSEVADKVEEQEEKQEEKATPKNEITIIAWVLLFIVLVLVFGFWVGIMGFVPIFMVLFGRETLKVVVPYTVIFWLVIYVVFHVALGTSLFGGVWG